MTSYLTALWSRLTGRSTPNSTDFLDALRPRRLRRTPRRLPNTPTASHLPATRPIPKDTGRKSRQCPHCRNTFYLELPAGRISKPLRSRKVAGGRKGRGKRWVSVGDEYLVEDLSPIVTRGYSGIGSVDKGLGRGKKR